MIDKYFLLGLFLTSFWVSSSQTTIKNNETQFPVSYAAISFGNGQGLFADAEGVFIFTKKLYPDIDSLFISALGFKDLTLATSNLSKTLFLESQADELDEVLVSARISRKFKVQKMKPFVDSDYYKCWLPTIESEIAVFFENEGAEHKKISTVYFPIALESSDWNKRKRSNADKKKFSTLFKVKFYANKNGAPGDVINNETIVFRVTEKNGDVFELDVDNNNIFIPKSGIFISLQVLGYTDKSGKLLPNKKYKEVKMKDGRLRKIPTNFRPLLPFTDKILKHNTYIKRVFLNGNDWVIFKKENVVESSLLAAGLNNYGIGININIFKDE